MKRFLSHTLAAVAGSVGTVVVLAGVGAHNAQDELAELAGARDSLQQSIQTAKAEPNPTNCRVFYQRAQIANDMAEAIVNKMMREEGAGHLAREPLDALVTGMMAGTSRAAQQAHAICETWGSKGHTF